MKRIISIFIIILTLTTINNVNGHQSKIITDELSIIRIKTENM